MQEPEENKRHWGAKSYKSLWILPLIAFIAIFFLASSRNYIFEWQKEKDLQALGMIMKG